MIAPEILDRMTDVMEHRGPDDRGTYAEPGVALGVRRLSIVDVDSGHQPVSNESGEIWAIQNGELYNHVALRTALSGAGHRFRSDCDTDVLPHLYERHGESFPTRLRGMFGIAIWDGPRRKLVLSRDRLGIKPLYYARCGDLLVFASELKSVLASGLVPEDLDYEAIDAYLRLGFVPGPRTPLAAVTKLEPGHSLVIEPDVVRHEKFWQFPQPTEDASLSDEEHAERLRSELEESIRLRLMSDVPLGAMLSGGLDSSVIVALMAKQMSRPVQTFAVGFRDAGNANELGDARMVASALGADHHELELSLSEDVVDLPELVWALDEPLADLSSLGFLALSELAARHVTVALSGQGADEMLGGYDRHRNAARLARLDRLGPLALGALRIAGTRSPRARRAAEILATDDAAEQYLLMKRNVSTETRDALVRGQLAAVDGRTAERAAAVHALELRGDLLQRTLHLDGRLGLVDDMLHYFDRASMAKSLEVRVPFLDHRLVEYCATIPSRLKVRGGTTKYLLRRVARGLVPDAVIDKPKVGFFNGAVDAWFRSQLTGPVSDYLLAPDARYREFLDGAEIERLVRSHAGGGPSRDGQLLLSVLMLEVWLSSFLPRARAEGVVPSATPTLT